MSLWIPLTWRKGEYVGANGAPVRRALRALVVSTKTRRVLGTPELVIRLTLVNAKEVTVTRPAEVTVTRPTRRAPGVN